MQAFNFLFFYQIMFASESRKSQTFRRQLLLYLQPSSLYNLNLKLPMLPLHSPHSKGPHLHESQFSSSDIFCKITGAFLKTCINLRSLPPAHSRGAVTFSGLWFVFTKKILGKMGMCLACIYLYYETCICIIKNSAISDFLQKMVHIIYLKAVQYQ